MRTLKLLILLSLLVPSLAHAQYRWTLKNPTVPIPIQAVDSTTGAEKTDVVTMNCRLLKNGVDTACAGTSTEISDANLPGTWKYVPTNGELDTLGVYEYRFSATGMTTFHTVSQVTNDGGDDVLAAISGTTLTLGSNAPVNADGEFDNGFEIVFYNSGHVVAASCITSSTNTGEFITTEEDLSTNPGVGVGIPYKVRESSACHITSAKIVNYALTENKFGPTNTFAAGSTSTSWVLNAGETSSDISGQEIVHVPSLQARECITYNTTTKTCVVKAGVTPVSGDKYVVRGSAPSHDFLATAVPGSYPSGTVGNIIGNRLDAAVSSRLADATYIPPANFSSMLISGGGAVTVGTNNDKTGYTASTVTDKTGYSLTQAFPANFSSELISVGGAVTVGTNNDKTGYTATSVATVTNPVTVGTNNDKTGYSILQSFPANFGSMAITSGGSVTVGTNSDKTGYSLTQAFPANFSSELISVGGATTVGTNNDKSGYSLTQAFPANFSSELISVGGAVTVGTNNDKTGYTATSVTNPVTVGTNNDKTGYTATSVTNPVTVGDLTSTALSKFFSVDSGTTEAAAVAGSVVKEITTNAIGANPWDMLTAAHNILGSFGASLGSVGIPWDIARAGHTTPGTFGEGIPVAPGAIGAAQLGTDVEGHIGTAQAITLNTIKVAAAENFPDNALSNNASVIIWSATTGANQTRCICGNAQSTDMLTLCQGWTPAPTGTVKYSIKWTPNCNPSKWPVSR